MKTNILFVVLSFIAINIFAQHTSSDAGMKLKDDYKYLYTLPEDIQNLKIGMNLNNIKKTLNVEPYDIHFLDENNHKLIVYRFIIIDKVYKKSSKSNEYWQGDIGKLYILMEDDKIKSYLTDQGGDGVITVLAIGNRIKLANNSNDIAREGDILYYHSKSEISVDTKTEEKQPSSIVAPVEEKKKSVGKAVLISLGLVVLLSVIASAI